MPRPLWKGVISFGLVTIPIALFSAEATEANIDLDMLDSHDHARIRYRRVNERTGKEVPWKSIVKGYKVDGRYIVLEPKDFERAAKSVVRGIEVLEFVDRSSLSPLLFVKPYYTAPTEGGETGYVLLRDALDDAQLVGIVNMVLHSRQHLAALMVIGGVLTLVTLRYASELRQPSEIEIPKGRAKAKPREMEMARKLVAGMKTTWKPDEYKDEYKDALLRILRAKSKGALPVEKEETNGETLDSYTIVDLLKQSLERQAKAGKRHTKRPRADVRVHRRKAV